MRRDMYTSNSKEYSHLNHQASLMNWELVKQLPEDSNDERFTIYYGNGFSVFVHTLEALNTLLNDRLVPQFKIGERQARLWQLGVVDIENCTYCRNQGFLYTVHESHLSGGYYMTRHNFQTASESALKPCL